MLGQLISDSFQGAPHLPLAFTLTFPGLYPFRIPLQNTLPVHLPSFTLAFLAGTALSGNEAPSFSSSPSWEAGLGLWQLGLGALSSAGKGKM